MRGQQKTPHTALISAPWTSYLLWKAPTTARNFKGFSRRSLRGLEHSQITLWMYWDTMKRNGTFRMRSVWGKWSSMNRLISMWVRASMILFWMKNANSHFIRILCRICRISKIFHSSILKRCCCNTSNFFFLQKKMCKLSEDFCFFFFGEYIFSKTHFLIYLNNALTSGFSAASFAVKPSGPLMLESALCSSNNLTAPAWPS